MKWLWIALAAGVGYWLWTKKSAAKAGTKLSADSLAGELQAGDASEHTTSTRYT